MSNACQMSHECLFAYHQQILRKNTIKNLLKKLSKCTLNLFTLITIEPSKNFFTYPLVILEMLGNPLDLLWTPKSN